MSLPDIASRQDWLAARKQLLAREKELTRQRDALNADRRRLPMVAIGKEYVFDGPDGEARLPDLFDGRRQLIVQHFMFHPDWDAGCPSCTAGLDEMSPGLLAHLNARDTSFAVVSRAPLAKLAAYRAERGWTVPWYSSYRSDFNYDFHVTLDESVALVEYNYRDRAALDEAGLGWLTNRADQPMEMPGMSFFLLDGGRVFHTNSLYARGMELLGGSYYFLDQTALGRQEDWEEPKGRSDSPHAAVPSFTD